VNHKIGFTNLKFNEISLSFNFPMIYISSLTSGNTKWAQSSYTVYSIVYNYCIPTFGPPCIKRKHDCRVSMLYFQMVYISSLKSGNITWKHDCRVSMLYRVGQK